MPNRGWLEQYSGETVDQLLAYESKFRVDSLVIAFEQAMDQKAAKVGMEGLTFEEQTILAVEALEREVNNGGYHQFFVNTPEHAPIIVQSLRRIGCPKTTEITQRAIAVLGLSNLTVGAIESVIAEEDDKRWESLGECDTKYYEGAECIEEKLFAFIKANKSRISPLKS